MEWYQSHELEIAWERLVLGVLMGSVLYYCIPHFEKVLGKSLSRNGLKVDANSLLRVNQMRRSVEAGFLWETSSRAECSEEGFYKSACASFAFSSSNMNNVELIDVGSLREVSFALGTAERRRSHLPNGQSGSAIASSQVCWAYLSARSSPWS